MFLCNVHMSHCNVHMSLCNVHMSLCNVHMSLCNVHMFLCNVHISHCNVYISLQCPDITVQCSHLTPHSAVATLLVPCVDPAKYVLCLCLCCRWIPSLFLCFPSFYTLLGGIHTALGCVSHIYPPGCSLTCFPYIN